MATVILNFDGNQGYSAEQVENRTITLRDLRDALEQAIADHGEDTPVVLADSGNQYGAQFGVFNSWVDLFETDQPTDEED
jgi:hypothetical protein